MSWRHLLRSQLTPQHPHGEGLHDPPHHSSDRISHYLPSSCAKNPGVAYASPALSNPHALCQERPSPGLISSVHPCGVTSRHSRGLRVLGQDTCLCHSSTCLSSSASITLCGNYCFIHMLLSFSQTVGLCLLCIPRNQQINSSCPYCRRGTGVDLSFSIPSTTVQFQPPASPAPAPPQKDILSTCFHSHLLVIFASLSNSNDL